MNTFFIIALPRSRTAWLANFLTNDESFCFHYGIWKYGVDGIRAKMLALPAKTIGSSDTAAMFYMDKIISVFPGAKIIAIDRNIDDIISSLRRCGLDESPNIELMESTFSNAKKFADIIIVYDDINIMADQIWEYVTRTECDMDRLEMLKGMNIQITKETIQMIRNTVASLQGAV